MEVFLDFIEPLSVNETNFLRELKDRILNPSSAEFGLVLRDEQFTKINLACFSRDGYKIAIRFESNWEVDDGGLSKIQVSWLDTASKKGSMIEYKVTGDKVIRILHGIKNPNDWVDGDIMSAQVYDLGNTIGFENLPVAEIEKLLNGSNLDKDFQEKVCYWYNEWYGIQKKGDAEVI